MFKRIFGKPISLGGLTHLNLPRLQFRIFRGFFRFSLEQDSSKVRSDSRNSEQRSTSQKSGFAKGAWQLLLDIHILGAVGSTGDINHP